MDKPRFDIDPPTPTWTTDVGTEQPEEDWEAELVDYGGVGEVEDLDVDVLMEGF